jgi:thiol-disulfide isomerase/thioredoxin
LSTLRYGLLLLSFLTAATLAQSANYRIVNKGREGQPFNITDHLIKGKLNLVEFSSQSCPSCEAFTPKLLALAQKNPDTVVNQVLIDRPGSQGIDWQSPLARQYELRSVPYFKVYDPAGKLMVEGEPARKLIAKMLVEAKLL